MKKLIIVLAALTLIGGFVFAGGGGQIQGQGAAVTEDRMFNVVMTAAFTGFDPLRTNDGASSSVNTQMYETLYRVKIGEAGFDCLLAESLPEFSADGRQATIKLRRGVRFHDGTPFNADAVKYTIDLIKDPQFGSARASIVSSIDRVEILDDYTIRLHLNYEDGVIIAKLAHLNSAIVSPTAQKSQDLMVKPVGTGPFKFVSAISQSQLVLVRNDDYWGKKPQLKNVTVTVITDESTAVSRLETGEADFFYPFPPAMVNRAKAIRSVTVQTSESSNMFYIGLRPNSWLNPKMADLNFRIAIAKSMDIKGFVDSMIGGYGVAAHSVMGAPVFGYDPNANAGYPYDLEGAKKMIADNNWGNEPLRFLVPSTPGGLLEGEYFQANLKAAGFNNVTLETVDWAAWLTESKVPNRFDITVDGWSNVTRDGSELFEPIWHSTNSARRFFTDSKALDDMIFASKTTSVAEERIRNLRAIDNFLMKEAYVIPIYYRTNLFVYNSAYAGVNVDSGGVSYLVDITIK